MPWLIVGLVVLLIARAGLAQKPPTAATLDPNLPPRVAQAVIRAWTTEPDKTMRQHFAQVLKASGYPKAAAALASR